MLLSLAFVKDLNNSIMHKEDSRCFHQVRKCKPYIVLQLSLRPYTFSCNFAFVTEEDIRPL